MDFSGHIVLSVVEEDNVQRAYFRVRPLLCSEGAITPAELEKLPDDGYLRVVPDKNEQHTFKDRMRELGGICVLDLMNLPADAVKIRPNKNYAPQKGETNQFIVYSDAVQAVPDRLFYEVISAETEEKEKINRAATPFCYLRSGGRIFGPVSRSTGLEQEGAAMLPPDSDGIFSVTLPDGSEKLFYWPRSSLLKDLDESGEEGKETDQSGRQDMKLSGMPLYQTSARHVSVPQRAHSALADAVGQQLRSGQTDPPGAVLNHTSAMHPVENPMDAFRRSLDELWALPDMQRQAAAHFLSMTGVQAIINQQLCRNGTDAVASAIDRQIQDLEAERLALLMQLENAQKNISALRQEAIAQAVSEEKETLIRLRQQADSVRADLEKAEIQRGEMLKERDRLIGEIGKADSTVKYIRAEAGGYADLDTLCMRMEQSLGCAGIACGKNDALHILCTLYAAPDLIGISMDSVSDAVTAAQAIAGALGVKAEEEDAKVLRVAEGGDSFLMGISLEPRMPRDKMTWMIADSGLQSLQVGNDLYDRVPWPVISLYSAEGWEFRPLPVFSPVKVSALNDIVSRERRDPPRAALELIAEMGCVLKKNGCVLSCRVRRQIYDYLSAAGMLMKGGIADALDYAVCAWILPCIRRSGCPADLLLPFMQGLPRSEQQIGKAVI